MTQSDGPDMEAQKRAFGDALAAAHSETLGDPLRMATPEEIAKIDRIVTALAVAHTTGERDGLNPEWQALVTSAYEKVLDALMYGFPGAVLRGWDRKE